MTGITSGALSGVRSVYGSDTTHWTLWTDSRRVKLPQGTTPPAHWIRRLPSGLCEQTTALDRFTRCQSRTHATGTAGSGPSKWPAFPTHGEVVSPALLLGQAPQANLFSQAVSRLWADQLVAAEAPSGFMQRTPLWIIPRVRSPPAHFQLAATRAVSTLPTREVRLRRRKLEFLAKLPRRKAGWIEATWLATFVTVSGELPWNLTPLTGGDFSWLHWRSGHTARDTALCSGTPDTETTVLSDPSPNTAL